MTLRADLVPLGRLEIIAHDAGGRELWRRRLPNLITDGGRELLTRLVTGTAVIDRLDMVIGAGIEDPAADEPWRPAAGNTQLHAPFHEHGSAKAEVLGTSTIEEEVDGAVQRRKAVMVTATFPAREEGDEQAINEAGILVTLNNQVRSTYLYNHVRIPVITRTLALSLTLNWELVF